MKLLAVTTCKARHNVLYLSYGVLGSYLARNLVQIQKLWLNQYPAFLYPTNSPIYFPPKTSLRSIVSEANECTQRNLHSLERITTSYAIHKFVAIEAHVN